MRKLKIRMLKARNPKPAQESIVYRFRTIFRRSLALRKIPAGFDL